MIVMRLKSTLILIFYGMIGVLPGAIEIRSDNIQKILSSNELVFVNFYAHWCRFSQNLNPIYDQLAEKVSKEYSEKNFIVIGKVDSEAEPSISNKYHVKKYPTLKLFRNGLLIKGEYRGAREVNPLFEYVRKQVQSSIMKIDHPLNINLKGNYIVGYFNNENSSAYKTFSKVSNLLRDECQFIQIRNKSENASVVFHSSNGEEMKYNGQFDNERLFYLWSNEKCVRLIREITFENAEELTDEGLPFLILFHHLNDEESVSLFEKSVSREVVHERLNINCLHGDGSKFVHPLKHLGKSLNDLPLLVLDTFKHMFLFPDIKQLEQHGKLLQFIKDFQSGKLHEDFDKSLNVNKGEGDMVSGSLKRNGGMKTPPESIFVRLSPSRERYSFRDEL